MQLFSADATILKKKKILPTKSWKKHPQRFLRKTQIHYFSLLPWAAQTAQTEELMFQNMAYRPTVYRNVSFLILCTEFVKSMETIQGG